MCISVFAFKQHSEYDLILAANRDEIYARPTAPSDYWKDHPEILGGRDLEQGGTWLGINRENGRFALVTNYRDPSLRHDLESRGHLVSGYLLSQSSPQDWISSFVSERERYNPCNLIVGSREGILYASTQLSEAQSLGPGIYGLSNRLLDTPWPKVLRAKERFAQALLESADLEGDLLRIMKDETRAGDSELPNTGVSLEWERALSSVFIRSPKYGTRSTSILLIRKGGSVSFSERTHEPGSDRFVDRKFAISVP